MKTGSDLPGKIQFRYREATTEIQGRYRKDAGRIQSPYKMNKGGDQDECQNF